MKDLYKIAANGVSVAYKDNIDLGTTEFKLTTYKSLSLQQLSIPGTNEGWDWVKNIDLRSIRGYKRGNFNAALDILGSNEFQRLRKSGFKLLISVHSKSAGTGVVLKHYFGIGDWLVMFAPAPSMRRSLDRNMENTTMFIDPDDIVHEAGIINFGHPECEVIKGANDHKGKYIPDHFMEHWIEFVDGMDYNFLKD